MEDNRRITAAQLDAAWKSISDRIPFRPEIGIVLGSGLGDLADRMELKASIDYSEIDGFPVSTVAGHKGRFLFAEYEGRKLVLMQGRVHYYEGYTMPEVVLPVRLMHKMGIKVLVLTNAAGGIAEQLSAGDLMLITDHITSFVPSPLIGKEEGAVGTMFPDMSSVYDKELCAIMRHTADELGIDLKEGVYLQTTGPNYETPAEITLFRTIGAGAVGMSTAVEAMVACSLGLRIAGVSCITNKAAGLGEEKLLHSDVTKAAAKAAGNFSALLLKFLINVNL